MTILGIPGTQRSTPFLSPNKPVATLSCGNELHRGMVRVQINGLECAAFQFLWFCVTTKKEMEGFCYTFSWPFSVFSGSVTQFLIFLFF